MSATASKIPRGGGLGLEKSRLDLQGPARFASGIPSGSRGMWNQLRASGRDSERDSGHQTRASPFLFSAGAGIVVTDHDCCASAACRLRLDNVMRLKVVKLESLGSHLTAQVKSRE